MIELGEKEIDQLNKMTQKQFKAIAEILTLHNASRQMINENKFYAYLANNQRKGVKMENPTLKELCTTRDNLKDLLKDGGWLGITDYITKALEKVEKEIQTYK